MDDDDDNIDEQQQQQKDQAKVCYIKKLKYNNAPSASRILSEQITLCSGYHS